MRASMARESVVKPHSNGNVSSVIKISNVNKG